MPVVLHIDGGLPEAEVLTLGIYLPLNLVRLALNEVLQIEKLGLGKSEVGQPERILVIIDLAPNHAGPELDVVSSSGPGERTLFLKHVVDVEDGNVPVVAEREAAAHGAHWHDVDGRQPGNLIADIRVRHPEFLAGVSALIRSGVWCRRLLTPSPESG